MMQGAAGASGAQANWVDEVFNIQTFKGTGNANQIVNGVDNTKGGMLLWATRSHNANRYLYDTVGGRLRSLYPDSTSAGDIRSGTPDIQSFNNNGYTLMNNNINHTSYESVIWNFRKAPGFFECFEYTGTGSDNNIINHKLDALPGLVIVKRTDASGNWVTIVPWTGMTEYAIGSNNTQFIWDAGNRPYTVSAFSNIATTNTLNVSRLQWHEGNGTFDFAAADTNANGATYMCYMWSMGNSDSNVFGENNDTPIIKCGIYQGNGSDRFIDVGWEPQWIMYKSVFGGNDDWQIYDSQRGVNAYPKKDMRITLNSSGAESAQGNNGYVSFEGNGYRIFGGNNEVNNASRRYFYMIIRKSDGYVGKPAEVGTDVYTTATRIPSASTSNDKPAFSANFSVDGSITTNLATSDHNYLLSKKMGNGLSNSTDEGYLHLDMDYNESTTSHGGFDRNNGWSNGQWASTAQSWMWKSGKGFDVQCYSGNGMGGVHYHSMGQVPEMIWTKKRQSGGNTSWVVGHFGMNNGVNPWHHYMRTNISDGQNDDNKFYDWVPDSTTWRNSSDSDINGTGHTYVSWLFSSVAGISKCGYYVGSSSDLTITTGFQPRLLFIKRSSGNGGNWVWLDTVRGWGSGADAMRYINSNSNPGTVDVGAPTSTGFTLNTADSDWNSNGQNYIYYAHA